MYCNIKEVLYVHATRQFLDDLGSTTMFVNLIIKEGKSHRLRVTLSGETDSTYLRMVAQLLGKSIKLYILVGRSFFPPTEIN